MPIEENGRELLGRVKARSAAVVAIRKNQGYYGLEEDKKCPSSLSLQKSPILSTLPPYVTLLSPSPFLGVLPTGYPFHSLAPDAILFGSPVSNERVSHPTNLPTTTTQLARQNTLNVSVVVSGKGERICPLFPALNLNSQAAASTSTATPTTNCSSCKSLHSVPPQNTTETLTRRRISLKSISRILFYFFSFLLYFVKMAAPFFPPKFFVENIYYRTSRESQLLLLLTRCSSSTLNRSRNSGNPHQQQQLSHFSSSFFVKLIITLKNCYRNYCITYGLDLIRRPHAFLITFKKKIEDLIRKNSLNNYCLRIVRYRKSLGPSDFNYHILLNKIFQGLRAGIFFAALFTVKAAHPKFLFAAKGMPLFAMVVSTISTTFAASNPGEWADSYDPPSHYVHRYVIKHRRDLYPIHHASHVTKRYARAHSLNYITSIGEDHHVYEIPGMPKASSLQHDILNKSFLQDPDVLHYEQQAARKRVKRAAPSNPYWMYSSFNDPKFAEQWYLHRRVGLDINTEEAWRLGFTGRGVVVTILDDGIEKDHPELMPNYDPDASYDINGEDPDPQPRYDMSNENRHGTRCAGEVAAVANNSVCIVGVAFNARIGGVRMLDGDVTDEVESRAIGLNPDHVDIYSASWGPDDDGKTLDGPARLAQEAFENGVTKGRRGLGSIFAWASGNGGRDRDNCNCDGYTNSRYTLSISSATESGHVPWYSEPCSSTLATTYSSGSVMEHKIISTDLRHECTESHTGTSASAPLAAGIIALTLEANPNLGWRDMQHLVVATSNPNYLYVNDWLVNGVGRKVSHSFGYGMMDAGAMVKAARIWRNAAPANNCTVMNTRHSGPIPPGGSIRFNIETDGCLGKITRTNDVNKNRNFFGYGSPFNSEPDEGETDEVYSYGNHVKYLEHVQARVSLKAPERGQIEIFLTSPAGTVSKLLFKRPKDFSRAGINGWPFMTTHSWGELSYGTWILEIKNGASTPGYLVEWSLIMHGTETQPETLAALSNAASSNNFVNGFKPAIQNYLNNNDAELPSSDSTNVLAINSGEMPSVISPQIATLTERNKPFNAFFSNAISPENEKFAVGDSSLLKFAGHIPNCFKMLYPGHCLVCDDSYALFEGMCLNECPPNLYKSLIMTPPIVFPTSSLSRRDLTNKLLLPLDLKLNQSTVMGRHKRVLPIQESSKLAEKREDLIIIDDAPRTESLATATISENFDSTQTITTGKGNPEVDDGDETTAAAVIVNEKSNNPKKKHANLPKKKIIKKLFSLVCKTCHSSCKRCKDGGRTHCTECHDGHYLASLAHVNKKHRESKKSRREKRTLKKSQRRAPPPTITTTEDSSLFDKFMASQEEEDIATGALCRPCHQSCRTCKGSHSTDCTSCPKTMPTPPFPVLTPEGKCLFLHNHGHVRSESGIPHIMPSGGGYDKAGVDLPSTGDNNFLNRFYKGLAGGSSSDNVDLYKENQLSTHFRLVIVIALVIVLISFFIAFFIVTKNLGLKTGIGNNTSANGRSNRAKAAASTFKRFDFIRRRGNQDVAGNIDDNNIENLDFKIRRQHSLYKEAKKNTTGDILAAGERLRLFNSNNAETCSTSLTAADAYYGQDQEADLNKYRRPTATDFYLKSHASQILGNFRNLLKSFVAKTAASFDLPLTAASVADGQHHRNNQRYKLVPLNPVENGPTSVLSNGLPEHDCSSSSSDNEEKEGETLGRHELIFSRDSMYKAFKGTSKKDNYGFEATNYSDDNIEDDLASTVSSLDFKLKLHTSVDDSAPTIA